MRSLDESFGGPEYACNLLVAEIVTNPTLDTVHEWSLRVYSTRYQLLGCDVWQKPRDKKLPRKTVATNIPGRVSIHQRPAEADGRRFGDWEMDLIVGKGQKSALLTLTERSTNYILMRFVPDKRPATVAAAAWRTLLPFKGHALKTITTDNGTEFAAHRTIAKRLGTTVYFADSHSAWQKGAVENANKLIRQYFPKGTDFNAVTAEQIRNVQFKINRRPREKLNFDSPKNVFFKFLR